MKRHTLVVAVALLALVLAGVPLSAQTPTAGWRLVGWNDLGMHCMDADFSVFSILPPYNNIHAQLVDASGNLVTNPLGITVTYKAVADPDGSFNSSSTAKTNFWQHSQELFGVTLPPEVGLAGNAMPGSANTPQAMTFNAAHGYFAAEGVPITPYDDARRKNPYPMMQLEARNSSGALLAVTKVVLPVSDEMDCRSCHGSGTASAAKPAAGWVGDCQTDRDYKLNILRLHDERRLGSTTYQNALATAGYSAAGLYATATTGATAVLCARCHASNALPGTGLAGIPPLTTAIHGYHASVTDPVTGQTLDAATNRTACYRCHPGSETRCLRGAMGGAVAADGTLAMQCQACHGSMSAVGATNRQGWFQQPNCQACHTGTATSNNGQIRYASAFDSTGSLRVAVNQTYATNPDTPAAGFSLYRFSSGHGGLQCEACHGATHAEYPSIHRNDNVQSQDSQGHVGVLSDCATCHPTVPTTTTGGPHGMHPVGQTWVSGHQNAAENNPAPCKTCHGNDYRGTVLSRALGDRTLSTSYGTKTFWRGFQVSCYDCHNGPGGGDGNPNHAPLASNGAGSTVAYTPVALTLAASDQDGNPLSRRIVTQPSHGTVALAGTQATYRPEPGFVGSDAFTFGALDGQTASNLATVGLTTNGSFADVPSTSSSATWIERLYHSGITAGCTSSPLTYCPSTGVSRAQMAVFLVRGIHGASFTPPAATGIFADVPATSSSAPWVEQLYRDGVTAGCATAPLRFCPSQLTTRGQMAAFLLRTRHPQCGQPSATGTVFRDVPASYPGAGWIEQLLQEGITSGCAAGLYCPTATVSRAQMATFLVRTFRLP